MAENENDNTYDVFWDFSCKSLVLPSMRFFFSPFMVKRSSSSDILSDLLWSHSNFFCFCQCSALFYHLFIKLLFGTDPPSVFHGLTGIRFSLMLTADTDTKVFHSFEICKLPQFINMQIMHINEWNTKVFHSLIIGLIWKDAAVLTLGCDPQFSLKSLAVEIMQIYVMKTTNAAKLNSTKKTTALPKINYYKC